MLSGNELNNWAACCTRYRFAPQLTYTKSTHVDEVSNKDLDIYPRFLRQNGRKYMYGPYATMREVQISRVLAQCVLIGRALFSIPLFLFITTYAITYNITRL